MYNFRSLRRWFIQEREAFPEESDEKARFVGCTSVSFLSTCQWFSRFHLNLFSRDFFKVWSARQFYIFSSPSRTLAIANVWLSISFLSSWTPLDILLWPLASTRQFHKERCFIGHFTSFFFLLFSVKPRGSCGGVNMAEQLAWTHRLSHSHKAAWITFPCQSGGRFQRRWVVLTFMCKVLSVQLFYWRRR